MARLRFAPAALALCLAPLAAGCEIAEPFEGPGYVLGDGLVDPKPDGTYVVAATHLVVDPDARAEFEAQVGRVLDVLEASDGYVGRSLRRQTVGDEYWTLTVWESEDAMYAFVGSDVHVEAMSRAAEFGRAGEVVRWEAPAARIPPSWDEVLERLQTDGRSAY